MLFEVGTQSQWNQIKFFFKDIMLFAKTVQKTYLRSSLVKLIASVCALIRILARSSISLVLKAITVTEFITTSKGQSFIRGGRIIVRGYALWKCKLFQIMLEYKLDPTLQRRHIQTIIYKWEFNPSAFTPFRWK